VSCQEKWESDLSVADERIILEIVQVSVGPHENLRQAPDFAFAA